MKLYKALLLPACVFVGLGLSLLGYEKAAGVAYGFVLGWTAHSLYRTLEELEFPWPWGPRRSWEDE